jgi:hypothetical protein
MHTHLSTDLDHVFLKGHVVIRCRDSIEDVATKISATLLGGLVFGGKDEGVYEEVPAVYADVIGLRFVLSGYAESHYVLECFPSPRLPESGQHPTDVDISSHLLRSLGNIEGAKIDRD